MKLPVDLIEKAGRQLSPTAADVRAMRSHITGKSAVELDGRKHYERRREMIEATAAEDVADAFERYIGTNDLLPINYLLLGYLQSRSVGRIRYFDKREHKGAVATGFLVSDSLVMTNHHVFPVRNAAEFASFAQNPTIEFNHEFDLDGNRPTAVSFALEAERFLHTSPELDMALIAVRPLDETGMHAVKSQGHLVLNGAVGKAGLGDFASIIQHPGGAEKQIAIRKNDIVNMESPDFIIYASDTAQGSSGAPVFNDQWQLIALHSAGVARKDGQGQYLDKDDRVIEVGPDGRVDGDRVVWESNRGVRVSAIMKHLAETAAADPLVQALFAPAYTDSRPYAYLSRPLMETERATPLAIVGPSTGAAPAGAAPVIITINLGHSGPVVTTLPQAVVPTVLTSGVDFEKKYEDELDFSDCGGFDANFMGEHVPMPIPNAALRQKLAYLTGSPNAYTLKYHHISTIHHAIRRVPIVSGINVHAKYRYAALDVEGARVDKWFRDNRLDYDVQLNDEFYKKSGFDRGHLARREDAEWGPSVGKAKLAADLTCSYANAVPQVPALNRAKYGYRGRWGQLEIELLEQGIENEEGKAARISVFNGPLFDDDDPVFKGVQVALSFYKVVVWYDGSGTLRTTCFRLSQEKLVGEIEFEVLRFDEIFKAYQVPIATIMATTGLEFHPTIVNNDTSSGSDEPLNEPH